MKMTTNLYIKREELKQFVLFRVKCSFFIRRNFRVGSVFRQAEQASCLENVCYKNNFNDSFTRRGLYDSKKKFWIRCPIPSKNTTSFNFDSSEWFNRVFTSYLLRFWRNKKSDKSEFCFKECNCSVKFVQYLEILMNLYFKKSGNTKFIPLFLLILTHKTVFLPITVLLQKLTLAQILLQI